MRPATASICASLLAAACTQPADESPPATPPAPAEPQSITYVCEGGAGAEARHGPDGQMTLVFGQTSFPMNQAEAVSGSRWVGQTLEWWVTLEAGQEVGTLRRLGPDRVGAEIIARCVRPTSGGVLAPDPAEAEPRAEATDVVAGAPCRSPALSLSQVGGDAGAGQRHATFAFRHEGSVACTLQGYPGLSLQGEDGALRTDLRIEREPGPYYADGQEPEVVTLPPQGQAFFDIHTTAVAGEIDGETEPCRAVARVRASPPEDTGSVPAAFQANPCNGRVRVSPFRPVEEPAR